MSFKNFSKSLNASNQNDVKSENKPVSSNENDKPAALSKDKTEPAGTISKP